MSNYPTRILKVTPTVAAAAHADGDALGGRLDFTGAFREGDGGGVLQSVTIIGLNTTTFEVDLMLFDREFTATADDDPFSTSDSDWTDKCIGYVKVAASDFVVTANHAVGVAVVSLPIQVANSPGTLYAQLVTRTAFTPAGITVKLGILKD